MGVAKTEWMETQERGWAEIEDTYVCEDCVHDEFLKQRLRAAVEANECDYCGRTAEKSIAAPVRVIQEIVGETVSHFFAEPSESGCPYDGGFIIEPTDTDDVLLTLNLNCDDGLFADIKDAFTNDDWIPAAQGHWSSLHPNETLRYSWDRFSRWVQHETRFFFSQVSNSSDDHEPQEIRVGDVLPTIGDLVTDLGLISNFPSKRKFYRARRWKPGATWVPSADTLGAPPSESATAGRMNPAGISYLYLADEEDTAIKEIMGDSSGEVVVAEFATIRELKVLDLIRLPDKPSIFDADRRDEREGIIFLEHFVGAISQPTAKDGREHVSYAPSQVMSEYFALVFKNDNIAHIEGIRYPSAVLSGGHNLVLFPTTRGVKRIFGTVEFHKSTMKAFKP
jgi:RES domain-containing protein